MRASLWEIRESPDAPIAMKSDMLARAIGVAARPAVATEGSAPFDAGPALIAALSELDEGSRDACAGAWIESFPEQASTFGVVGGAAALLVGARALARIDGRFIELSSRLAEAVAAALDGPPSNRGALRWHDYDLISGPSGAILALDMDVGGAAIANDLVARAAAPTPRFTVDVDPGDTLIGWNRGRLNLGLAHGVPGVLAALTRRYAAGGSQAPGTAAAISHLIDWLWAQAYEDHEGRIVWDPGERRPREEPQRSRRHAWCYGAPGVAWAIWEAAAAIGRLDAQTLACEAFVRFARRFDPQTGLDRDPMEAIAFCHGAAGILAVADSFGRAADLTEGVRLAAELESLLYGVLPRLDDLARRNRSLLTGSGGVLAVLLVRRGADRTWLRSMALQ
jgi:hypothetical protein